MVTDSAHHYTEEPESLALLSKIHGDVVATGTRRNALQPGATRRNRAG
jgi:hypothetical protein